MGCGRVNFFWTFCLCYITLCLSVTGRLTRSGRSAIPVSLSLLQDDFDSLRPLCYLCLSLCYRTTLTRSGRSAIPVSLSVTGRLWLLPAALLSLSLSLFYRMTDSLRPLCYTCLSLCYRTTDSLRPLCYPCLSLCYRTTLTPSGRSTISVSLSVTGRLWLPPAALLSLSLSLLQNDFDCLRPLCYPCLSLCYRTTLTRSGRSAIPVSLSVTGRLTCFGRSAISVSLSVTGRLTCFGRSAIPVSLSVTGRLTCFGRSAISVSLSVTGRLTRSGRSAIPVSLLQDDWLALAALLSLSLSLLQDDWLALAALLSLSLSLLQDDFDSLRPLCYPATDVFLLCFSVVSPTSFDNAASKWLPELRHHGASTPIILVGTQSDLRGDVKVLVELAAYGERPVPPAAAKALARSAGAATYIECSALTQSNLKEVFDTSILVALGHAGRADDTRWNSGEDGRTAAQPGKAKKRWRRFCCLLWACRAWRHAGHPMALRGGMPFWTVAWTAGAADAYCWWRSTTRPICLWWAA